jgi:hypothetical protein
MEAEEQQEPLISPWCVASHVDEEVAMRIVSQGTARLNRQVRQLSVA